MGWFDEQLKSRQQTDNAAFEDALGEIAGAVMGRRLTDALDNQQLANSAIDEILKYYHYKPKNPEEAEQAKTVEEQMEYRLRPFGILRRTVKLEKGWYRHAVGPMLGTLKDSGAAVAMLPGKLIGYSYYDFSTGTKVRLNRKTEQLLDSEAVCFYQPLPLKKLTMGDLLKFMLQQLSVSDLVMYVGMMLVVSLLGLLSPLFTKWLFGTVLESESTKVLLALAGFMICYSACRLLVGAFQTLVNARVSIKQDVAVQAAVIGRVISLPATFFKDYSAGELSQRASYVQALCSTLMNTIGNTGLTSLFSLIYLAQVFAFAPALVVPSLLITAATVIVSLIATFAQMKITKERMLLSSKTSGMTYSMITGIQKIKLAGAEKRMFSRWAKRYAKEASLEYNPPLFLKLSNTIVLAVSLLGTLVLYDLAVKSGVSVENYYAFNAAYGMVSGAFVSLAQIATSIANIKPTLEMAKPIMEAEPEASEGRELATAVRGNIELSHVSFRYNETMPNVVDDLSLKIRAGEYIAIVGATGCGKSTLLRLLLGFETPQKGAIYYDGKDLSRLDVRSVRQRIGTVMQDSRLFAGDIYSNILISAPQLTLNDAWEAAKLASVDEDIRAMPMGMHTMVSEGQGGISGGQRQRLMIARALAPKPKILMFDEATSALDNVTQKKVSEAIDGLKCTRIVIAHRLSTIRHCDRIIVLKAGKIIEDGNYESLIANKGYFAELIERQRLDTPEPATV